MHPVGRSTGARGRAQRAGRVNGHLVTFAADVHCMHAATGRSVLADTRVSDRSPERPASHSVRVDRGAGIRGRVHATRRPGPPAWRVPVLCVMLVAAFAAARLPVTVTGDEDGLEEFYATPEQIQPGEPGQLIKVEALEPGRHPGVAVPGHVPLAIGRRRRTSRSPAPWPSRTPPPRSAVAPSSPSGTRPSATPTSARRPETPRPTPR